MIQSLISRLEWLAKEPQGSVCPTSAARGLQAALSAQTVLVDSRGLNSDHQTLYVIPAYDWQS